jgi:HD-like signal output (HDOD) protein/ActR/RegA family two-component response regulator
MIKILFVDDEANVLDGLRRAMRCMRDQWDMRFCTSGADALAELAKCPADVIVTDMRMPGLDGAQLLQEIKLRYPGTIRFVLSGQAEPSSVLQAAVTAHQYLAKPCDTGVLKTAISRARVLKELLNDPQIAAWTGASEALPSLPAAYRRIVACLQDKQASIADVAAVVEEDLSVSTMLLKLANSAFFGSGQTIRTTERAVSFLGIDNVAALVLAAGVFRMPTIVATADLAELWRHSLQTAAIARALAIHEKWSALRADDAFLAGMLHDLGHLVIATAAPGVDMPGAAGIDHGQVGAYLVGLWGFPDNLVEAIAFHQYPSRAGTPGISLPVLLHAANLLAHGNHDGGAGIPGMDHQCFDAPGMLERWHQWEACILPAARANAGAMR